jgi:hypothetical protein
MLLAYVTFAVFVAIALVTGVAVLAPQWMPV